MDTVLILGNDFNSMKGNNIKVLVLFLKVHGKGLNQM